MGPAGALGAMNVSGITRAAGVTGATAVTGVVGATGVTAVTDAAYGGGGRKSHKGAGLGVLAFTSRLGGAW